MPSSLADRFQKVQETHKKIDTMEELAKLSFDELQNRVIRFGEAKVGQKYHEIVNWDPGYCKWFLRKYGDSEKEEHKEFSYFLSLWIERMETNLEWEKERNIVHQRTPSGKEGGKKSMDKKKDKARASSPAASWDVFSDPDCDLDQQAKEIQDYELKMTNARLDRLENAVLQMVHQVQQMSGNAPTPSVPN